LRRTAARQSTPLFPIADGQGPWEIIYLNPSDDPRKKK
jgi:hypothetical protein